MRCGEVVLLLAEAHAHKGDAVNVGAVIDPLIRNRLDESTANSYWPLASRPCPPGVRPRVRRMETGVWAEGKVYCYEATRAICDRDREASSPVTSYSIMTLALCCPMDSEFEAPDRHDHDQ